MPSRRRVLALAATAAVTGGCLGGPRPGATTPPPPPAPLTDGERRRATGATLSLAEDLSLEPSHEYLAANETIRYPATNAGSAPTSAGHIDLDEWMHLEAMAVAKRAVHRHLDAELSSTRWITVQGTARGGPATELEVVHLTYENQDGPDDTPPVAASALVSTTPQTVDITVRFKGEASSLQYPVFVAKWVGTHLESP